MKTTYLRTSGQSNNEVEGEENGNEYFAVSLDQRVLIAQRSDDRFRSAELNRVHNSINSKRFIQINFISKVITEESSPRVSNIRKKRTAQNGANGMVAIASGYTMNTRPGPSTAISCTSRFSLCAM